MAKDSIGDWNELWWIDFFQCIFQMEKNERVQQQLVYQSWTIQDFRRSFLNTRSIWGGSKVSVVKKMGVCLSSWATVNKIDFE